MRMFDDQVHGETLDGFAQKPIKKVVVYHATGTHKASFVTLKDGYAHVEIAPRDHLNSAALSDSKK